MTDRRIYFPGLDIYRALAVILMILAHAARLQTNITSLMSHRDQAGLLDWPFIAALIIEPVISATFLFIAGFSLVLSKSQSQEPQSQWFSRLGKRMLTLYAISVLFYFAEQGPQLPDLLISSGVLGIIAVGVFSSAILLLLPIAAVALLVLIAFLELVTLYLEYRHLNLVGLNAGAGGMLPLVVFAYWGAFCGLIWRRWNEKGLLVLLGLSIPVALLGLSSDYPWITYPVSQTRYYPGGHLNHFWFSLQDAFGFYEGRSQTVTVRYWNHGWIFAWRALPLLLMGLVVALHFRGQSPSSPPAAPSRRFIWLIWLGQKALNLYIVHLVLLAAFEVSGIKPLHGWQTLLMVAIILLISAWVLRYVSFVPLRRISRIKKGASQDRGPMS